jgi:hypothetical protein
MLVGGWLINLDPFAEGFTLEYLAFESFVVGCTPLFLAENHNENYSQF